jgi:hypothetical protein
MYLEPPYQIKEHIANIMELSLLALGVFRVDVSVVIQILFRGMIQIVNLGARNVGNVK